MVRAARWVAVIVLPAARDREQQGHRVVQTREFRHPPRSRSLPDGDPVRDSYRANDLRSAQTALFE